MPESENPDGIPYPGRKPLRYREFRGSFSFGRARKGFRT
jgi:hypothetical protein